MDGIRHIMTMLYLLYLFYEKDFLNFGTPSLLFLCLLIFCYTIYDIQVSS